MKSFQILGAAIGLAGLAQAHMEMIFPPPFKSKANPFANGDVDYSMTSPLEADGSNFPCKGYLDVLGTAAGASVATWNAGETYNMTITGGANHGGGSCQASLSFDQGKTWSVIHSYIGDCPGAGTTSYDFKLPPDTPSGDVLFAWTWFNAIGNREMYMNCAAITVKGTSTAKTLSNRPAMFVANVGSAGQGCATLENGLELSFPNPGSDVTGATTDAAKIYTPCDDIDFGTGTGGSDSGSDTPSSAAAAPDVPATTQPAAAPTASVVVSASVNLYVSSTQPSVGANPNSQASSPGGVFITVSEPGQAAPTEAATEAPVEAPTEAPVSSAVSAPAPVQSTLQTVTTKAPEAAPTTSTPAATPSSGAGTGSDSGSGEAFAAGTTCDVEGLWNCIGGSGYQRCASGQWSAVQQMAAGTTCEAGQMKTLAWGKKRSSFRRRSTPWRV